MANGFSPNGQAKRQAISPRARRMLREQEINPAAILGSGPGGRIVESDVQQAHSRRKLSPSANLSSMRRAVARVTTASAAIPQFQLQAELDATTLVSLRDQLLEPVQADSGLKLSLTDFFLLAQSRALLEIPRASSVWRDDHIVRIPSASVGLVVAVDDGLLVPVIADASRLSLIEMVRRRTTVIAAARNNCPLPDANVEAASSLSNLGHTRVDEFSALIMPPQSTMLAVGRIALRPFVVDGRLAVRSTLRLTLSVDHRVLDGVAAAKLLSRIVAYLEQPARLLFSETENPAVVTSD